MFYTDDEHSLLLDTADERSDVTGMSDVAGATGSYNSNNEKRKKFGKKTKRN